MALRKRMYELTTAEEVDAFLEKFPTSAFFKAGGCHKTMQGFTYVEQALNPRADLHMAFVRVIESRPASNHIAEFTGIIHQSPQFILMIDKKPVYDVDNWDINLDVVNQALNTHLGPLPENMVLSDAKTDTTFYQDLLRQVLADEITEQDFEQKWLSAFQADATLRSGKEFAILNSLYGDVDSAIQMRSTSGPLGLASAQQHSIKCRAKKVLAALEE